MTTGIRLLVKRLASEIEPWTGYLASLEAPGYTDDPNVVGAGEGVFTAEDWTRTRQRGLASLGTDGTQFDSDEKYLRYIFGTEAINVIGAVSLAQAFRSMRSGAATWHRPMSCTACIPTCAMWRRISIPMS